MREWLIEKAGIPEEIVPESGALPMRYNRITEDYEDIKQGFLKVDTPKNNTVCMQFVGRLAVHVGVCYNNHVYHVSSKSKSRLKDTIRNFEASARRVEYWHYDQD